STGAVTFGTAITNIGRFPQQAAGIRDILGTYRITKLTLVTVRAKTSETAFFAEKAVRTRKSVLTDSRENPHF
ncbi:MAG: hypothetical protein ACLVG5_14235, partial [Clostridium sp.]